MESITISHASTVISVLAFMAVIMFLFLCLAAVAMRAIYQVTREALRYIPNAITTVFFDLATRKSREKEAEIERKKKAAEAAEKRAKARYEKRRSSIQGKHPKVAIVRKKKVEGGQNQDTLL